MKEIVSKEQKDRKFSGGGTKKKSAAKMFGESSLNVASAQRPQTVHAGGLPKPSAATGARRPQSKSSSSGAGSQLLPAPKALPGQLFNMEYSPTRHLLGSPEARQRTADAGQSAGMDDRATATSSAVAKDRLSGLEDTFAAIDTIATVSSLQAKAQAPGAGGSATAAGGAKPTLNPRFLSMEGEGDGGAHRNGASRGGAASTTKGPSATSTTSAPMSTTAAGANVRRQRVEAFVGPVDKANRKIKRENDMLSRIAVLAQENCIDNDAKYDAALKTLRTELEFATVLRQDGSETLNTFNKQFANVQQQIDHLVATSENTGRAEHEAVRQAFDKQLEEQKQTLGRVRESGKNTTSEWKRRNEELQARLISLLDLTDEAYHRHVALTEESLRLRVEFQAQEGDEQLLQDELARVNYQHQVLKDRLNVLESEAAAAAVNHTIDGSNPAASGSSSGPVTFTHPLLAKGSSVRSGGESNFSPNSTIGGGADSESFSGLKNNTELGKKQQQSMSALSIHKAQILLETEAANLQAVRSAHVAALRQRTELEVFLRQSICLHKSSLEEQRLSSVGLIEAGPNSHGEGEGEASQPQMSNTHRASMMRLVGIMANGQGPAKHTKSSMMHALSGGEQPHVMAKAVQFSAADRSAVIDAMLSKKRVLQLMFEDPSSLTTTLVQTEPAALKDPGPKEMVAQGAPSRLRSLSKEYYSAAVGTVSSAATQEAAELRELYERWKMWTAEANEAFAEKGSGSAE